MPRPLNHRSTQVAATSDEQSTSTAETPAPTPDKGEILINPRYHFNSPLAVLQAGQLDRQEKIDVLSEWAADLLEERENFSRTFQMNQSAGSRELEEIQSALTQLSTRLPKAA